MPASGSNLGQLTRGARIADWVGKFALPPLALATAVSGAFLTYDWQDSARLHPGSATFLLLMDVWIGTVFFFFAITSFVVTVIQSVSRPSMMILQRKVDLVGESLRTLCDGLMTDLSAKLGIAAQDQSRVSIYIHDSDSSFVLLGRYSPNPLLRKPGRTSYPDDQGCISKGWQHGWWFENGLGNGSHYTRNTENRYGIPASDIPKFAMKSKLFGVHRVDHAGDPMAVVVVESMREDRFQSPTLEATLQQFVADYAPIIRAFRDYAPRPSIAKRNGL